MIYKISVQTSKFSDSFQCHAYKYILFYMNKLTLQGKLFHKMLVEYIIIILNKASTCYPTPFL